MTRLLIIGGSDAGISAALRARELTPDVEVTVVVADAFPNYSICGLPYYISGEVPDWHDLAHRTADEIERQGIQLQLNHSARAIDPARKRVTVVDAAGAARELGYDRLVVGTGATPVLPPVAGLDLQGVYPLHTMEDSFRVYEHVAVRGARSAVIVGAGYVGLEMADALVRRGLQVTTLLRSAVVLRSTLDGSLNAAVEEELRRHGVELVKNVDLASIEPAGSQLTLSGSSGLRLSTDAVLVATGVRPASELAAAAGVPTGVRGALRVDRRMATNLPDVYAAGDCVETWHRVLDRYVYLPLGTTAHKQGRVAGENAVGGQREFAGSLGTQVVKVFDLAVARTGLLEREALDAGFAAAAVEIRTWDHKVYYPGARELLIRVIGDRASGRLLGAQIVGPRQAEVAKRIDVFATALFHAMRVEELNDLDLSYTPPFSSPWDPVQMAAQAWVGAL